jgi:hypothetical protein
MAWADVTTVSAVFVAVAALLRIVSRAREPGRSLRLFERRSVVVSLLIITILVAFEQLTEPDTANLSKKVHPNPLELAALLRVPDGDQGR